MNTHLIAPDAPRIAEHSVAATVARQAACPVLLVNRTESHLSMAEETAVANHV